MNIFKHIILGCTISVVSTTTFAKLSNDHRADSTLSSIFDSSWSEFQYTEWLNGAKEDGQTGSGGGHQDFDAEYLFYKYEQSTNTLSIGLQTGFDVIDGKVWNNYYGGDLALSFDGSKVTNDYRKNHADSSRKFYPSEKKYVSNQYEYAVDFGWLTKGYSSNTQVQSGEGTASDKGIFQVATDSNGDLAWNNDIYYTAASPFAMADGTRVQNSNFSTSAGYSASQDTYWRIASFNLDNIVGTSGDFTVDAHWTMSCGNDDINGSFDVARSNNNPVPEPSILALMGIGSISVLMTGLRRRKRIK